MVAEITFHFSMGNRNKIKFNNKISWVKPKNEIITTKGHIKILTH